MKEINAELDADQMLRNAAEKAIDEAKKIKWGFSGVNWDDLRCVRVRHWMDDYGDSGFTVEIEKASPEAGDFRDWIAEFIKEETGISADVVAEW